MIGNPKPTGRTIVLSVTGMLMPWNNELQQPVVLRFPDSDKLFVPVWTEADDLRFVMDRLGADFDCIKQITHDREFLEGLRESENPNVRVMCNLRYIEDGNTRYSEIDPRNVLEQHQLQ